MNGELELPGKIVDDSGQLGMVRERTIKSTGTCET